MYGRCSVDEQVGTARREGMSGSGRGRWGGGGGGGGVAVQSYPWKLPKELHASSISTEEAALRRTGGVASGETEYSNR